MQKSTLKKLSQSLGISISTVSRALKDHPDISVATKKKVQDLAAAMEYEPNSFFIIVWINLLSVAMYYFFKALEELTYREEITNNF